MSSNRALATSLLRFTGRLACVNSLFASKIGQKNEQSLLDKHLSKDK